MAGVTETAFNKLKDRVRNLEGGPNRSLSTPPNSWIQRHQVLTWLISLTSGILAVIISIYVGVIPHLEKEQAEQIKNQLNDSLKQPLQNITQMGLDIASIKGTLQAWSPLITPQFFKKTASLPDKQFLESLSQLKAITQVASDSKIAIPAKDVSDIGTRTVALSSGNSESSALAWDTTAALLQYRSYLNSVTIQLGPQMPAPETFVTRYVTNPANFPQGPPIMRTIGASPAEDAAQLRTLSTPDLNKDLSGGASLLVLDTPVVIVDDLYAKNIVIENSHVIYHGGPAVLDKVYFLNCTFEIQKEARGQELAKKILAGPVTNFLPT